MLRFVTPVVHFRRTALRDTEIRGQKIAAGDKVVVFYSSANRDDAAFAEPERLDLARTPNLSRLPDLELAGPVERLRSNFINGPRRMPVRFTAR